MGNLKKLAGQTAIYGLTTILGKSINFILVPIHTGALSQAEFGKNVDFYSLIGFLTVLATYGFETAFFRFSEKPGYDRDTVYSTATISLLATSGVLFIAAFLGLDFWANLLLWEDHPEYVLLLASILVMDALAAIPFARLRAQNRSVRFLVVKLSLIGATFLFNILFFYVFPYVVAHEWMGAGFLQQWHMHEIGPHMIFYANLLGCVVMLLLLLPEYKAMKWQFDKVVWKSMLRFSLPLMIGGFAGIANELLDRQLLKYIPQRGNDTDVFEVVGIYGAVYKLSIFLVLFNQAFRYAAEPFFFAQGGRADNRQILAVVMRYFTIVLCVGFVMVTCSVDLVKYVIDEKFWSGLPILPILLLANIFLGINTHLSIWYKLSDKTGYGIIVTGIGLLATLGLNIWLIPEYGYTGAAWATLGSYFSMTAVSYWLGQRHYYIPYQTGRVLFHIALSIIFSAFAFFVLPEGLPLRWLVMFAYLGIVVALEQKHIMPYLKKSA
ncbi:MAG: oligosaccharide flippase family protein [Schleiferiaceae bacterium]|nr:oligosaccharide flippase family protein [Schleiferiaceae bacterium]